MARLQSIRSRWAERQSMLACRSRQNAGLSSLGRNMAGPNRNHGYLLQAVHDVSGCRLSTSSTLQEMRAFETRLHAVRFNRSPCRRGLRAIPALPVFYIAKQEGVAGNR